jgi:hypothetical protein
MKLIKYKELMKILPKDYLKRLNKFIKKMVSQQSGIKFIWKNGEIKND